MFLRRGPGMAKSPDSNNRIVAVVAMKKERRSTNLEGSYNYNKSILFGDHRGDMFTKNLS